MEATPQHKIIKSAVCVCVLVYVCVGTGDLLINIMLENLIKSNEEVLVLMGIQVTN